MSEMIERVARAIASNPPDERTEYRDSGPVIVRDFERTARAAIEGMREPTIEMRMDGAVEMVKHSNVAAAFTSMIDAALKEKS